MDIFNYEIYERYEKEKKNHFGREVRVELQYIPIANQRKENRTQFRTFRKFRSKFS